MSIAECLMQNLVSKYTFPVKFLYTSELSAIYRRLCGWAKKTRTGIYGESKKCLLVAARVPWNGKYQRDSIQFERTSDVFILSARSCRRPFVMYTITSDDTTQSGKILSSTVLEFFLNRYIVILNTVECVVNTSKPNLYVFNSNV